MSVKTYSKSQYGHIKLSANFTAREFACNDGSDLILIDDNLVTILQRVRNWANASVSISSAYRTAKYNKKVGGTSNSYHTKGQAADIIVTGKTPAEVAKFAEAIGVQGIGLYTSQKFVHVDTRTGKYFWKNAGKGNVTVGTHGGSCPYKRPAGNVRPGDKGDGVRWVQWWLRMWGSDIEIDGSFGAKTEAAVRAHQKKLGLTVDGIAGTKTKNGLVGDYRVIGG